MGRHGIHTQLAAFHWEALAAVEHVDGGGEARRQAHLHARRCSGAVQQHHQRLTLMTAAEGELLGGQRELLVVAVVQGGMIQAQLRQAGDVRWQVRLGCAALQLAQLQARTQRLVLVRRALRSQAKLAAVVDRRHAGDGEQQQVERVEVRRFAQFACHAVDIVVIGKIIQRQPMVQPALPELAVERISELEQICLHQAGVQALVHFVVGHRVRASRG